MNLELHLGQETTEPAEKIEPNFGPVMSYTPSPSELMLDRAAAVHDQAMALMRMRESLIEAGAIDHNDNLDAAYSYTWAWDDAVKLLAGSPL